MNEGLNLLGQQVAKNSVPVVLASDAATALNGIMDDGSEAGILRVDTVQGNLIPVPFIRQRVAISLNGTGAASYQASGIIYNEDGTSTGVQLNGGSVEGDFAMMFFTFYGRTLGLRFRSGSGDFSVSVDGGELKRVTDPEQYLNQESYNSNALHEVRVIPYTNLLTDSIHFGRIIVSKSKSTIFHGMLVEAGKGNTLSTKVDNINSTAITTVPTSLTNFAPYTAALGSSYPFQSVSGITYNNTTNGALSILWKDSGNTVIYMNKTIGANDSWTVPLAGPITTGQFSQIASGAGMTMMVWGKNV